MHVHELAKDNTIADSARCTRASGGAPKFQAPTKIRGRTKRDCSCGVSDAGEKGCRHTPIVWVPRWAAWILLNMSPGALLPPAGRRAQAGAVGWRGGVQTAPRIPARSSARSPLALCCAYMLPADSLLGDIEDAPADDRKTRCSRSTPTSQRTSACTRRATAMRPCHGVRRARRGGINAKSYTDISPEL
ncbi:hypothetical protein HYPSUDRAFT_205319 [Hypholoma sublateritium FD-334 SS-4]|uniref:Uncharacterized protein n=1 Tax=Hypholoma sublateritium (strain FD-334 SS-4) TaxID=945553 RepID=A0A0D2NNX5_HYPSF|nr:hypothetical protein HYPSUDRAFT_205319 [Hypholoma sublateritium FD-334 SS-4]